MPPSKRVKKPKPPASYTPWNCAILAVDPGERSGWSLWFNGSLIDWGECDAFFGAPADVLRSAKYFVWLKGETKQPPLIVVVERPFRTQYGTQVAVGAGDLVWRRAAEAAGLKSRIVRVYPATWRSKALPKGWAGGAKAKRASVKEIELAEAWKIVLCKRPSKWDRPNMTVGSESAPAILIGKWATHAGEVGARMPRTRAPSAAARKRFAEVAASNFTVHGETKNGVRTPEYVAWKSMKQRCSDSRCVSYPNYGGRGIRVCERWRVSFENFLADMGRRPSNVHSVDRIDTNGDYAPGNCRWATRAEQARNTRNSRRLTLGGRTQSLAGWADELKLCQKVLWRRLSLGWSDEDVLTRPLRIVSKPRKKKAA